MALDNRLIYLATDFLRPLQVAHLLLIWTEIGSSLGRRDTMLHCTRLTIVDDNALPILPDREESPPKSYGSTLLAASRF